MRFLSSLIFFFALNIHAAPTDIVFKQEGQLVQRISFKALTQKLKPVEVVIFEPHEKSNKSMRAFPLKSLLKSVYGEAYEKKASQISFTCIDGYKPNLPLARLSEGEPFLAFEEVGKSAFQIKKNDMFVNVVPYYLVWQTKLQGEALQTHLYSGNWPYQIVEIDLLK